MPTMRAFGKRMMENHIKPEYECFEIGHLDTVVNMANKGEVPGAPMQFNFVLGVSGCTPATVGNLDYLVKQIPAGSTWTVTGVGRGAWPMVAAGIVMGGNVRVGFEDNIYLEKGHKAASNGELVEKVVRLAKELGVRAPPPTRPERSCPWHNLCCSNLPNHTSLPQTPQPNQERNRRNFLCRRKATSTALTASSSPRAC